MDTIILFTDLDGTLLHARTYSYDEAQPALRLIRERGIPLILCSSKTRAELEDYRARLGNSHPFIAENGGGIFIPDGYFPFPVEGELKDGYRILSLGEAYGGIRARFTALRERLKIAVRGFGDMSIPEVMTLTGLDRREASLAVQREYDEPFVFAGPPDDRFLQAIEAEGLRWTQGRIFHIMGNHHKGRAVNILRGLFERARGPVVLMGLGDSLNDLPFLLAVDRPVLVRKEDGSHDSRISIPGLYRTERPGPAGWNEAVLKALDKDAGDRAAREVRIDRQTDHRKDLLAIFNAALVAVDPHTAVIKAVTREGSVLHAAGAAYDLAAFSRIIVVGAGKATARMALAIEELLGDRISEGLIIVKDGHTAPLRNVSLAEASHPVPNEAGVEATKRLLAMVRDAGEKTLVLCLLSGGASALLVAPMNGITLKDKQEATNLLLKAGASIGELNSVRKHLSAVKGGRFAKAACPAQIVTLILSDVIGDQLDVIASGPTARDGTTFADAAAVIEKYGLKDSMPAGVRTFLERGMNGQEPETVKSGDVCLHKTRNVIIGGIGQALSAAKEKARQLGYAPDVITAELQGEARDAARTLAGAALRTRDSLNPGEQRCLLSGGETTVTVRGKGTGGRNQELALAFALEISGRKGITLLSAGTDGTDGPTDAAGAVVDGETVHKARLSGIHPELYLGNNDSYSFFRKVDAATHPGHHVMTGPTGTNVMDLQIILITGTR